VQLQDVGVLEARGDLDLIQEPIRPQRRRQLGPQDFDRDPTIERRVVGEKDDGHPTAADLALDRVAAPARQRSREPRLKVVHGL